MIRALRNARRAQRSSSATLVGRNVTPLFSAPEPGASTAFRASGSRPPRDPLSKPYAISDLAQATHKILDAA
jgi:hypothetical protein